MSELRDLEMLRRRWRRARERLALVDETLGGFGRARLLAPVDPVTVRCVVLPADPEADTVEFDDAFWTRFVADTDEVPARRSRMWDREARPSAGAAILGRTYGGKCDRYVAVHRSGALEFCLGGDGARQWDERFRVFWMMPILCRVWEALSSHAAQVRQLSIQGPWEFTLALVDTADARLGGFARGWKEWNDLQLDQRPCQEVSALLRLELPELPQGEGLQALVYRVGTWIEEVWGTRERRYLVSAAVPDEEGSFDWKRCS